MTIEPLRGKGQQAVHLATQRLNIWEGSVRSGKTTSSLLAWLLFVRTGPAGNLLMVGRTERTLKRNVIDPLIEMLGPNRCRYVIGSGELWLLGRRIYVAGANDERAQEKIRGLTLAGAYVDEISILPESFWSMLLTRLSVDDAKMFGTTNPDNPAHWLMRDYLKKATIWLRHDGKLTRPKGRNRLDLARFSFRLRDNHTLSDTYIRNLELEFVGLWRKRFVEGLWVLAEGAIYDMLDTDNEHQVVKELPRLTDWTLCVDYGTSNAFVALLLGVGVDVTGRERLYAAREWRWDSHAEHRQLTDAEYSQRLRTWVDGLDEDLGQHVDLERIYVDPSAASFIAQLWRDNWSGVHGAENAVEDGIRSVASLLGGNHLRLHASLTGDSDRVGTIDELVGYVWDPEAAKRGKEQPLKVDDHGPDALRYGVMGMRRIWRHWLSVDLDLPEAA